MSSIRTLANRRSFSNDDTEGVTHTYNTYRDSVQNFWRHVRRFSPGSIICVDRDRPNQIDMVVSGWIAEVSSPSDRRRQVFSFQLAGDLIGRSSDSSERHFIALTHVGIGDAALLSTRGDAQWAAKIAEAANRVEELLLNHLIRIGRLTAGQRVLHLLLEFHDRLERAGLAKDSSYGLPVTQQMLADALGLSLVHMNRTLQELRRQKLITLGRGAVTLHDRHRLAAIACYEPCSLEKSSPPTLRPGAVTSNAAPTWTRGALEQAST